MGYVWRPLLYSTAVAGAVVVAQQVSGTTKLPAPIAPIGTLGAALAIFVAFPNNASYARWSEARTVWGNIQASSRILARQLIAATQNAIAAGTGGSRDEIVAYRRELVLRIIAFGHALRIQLPTPGNSAGRSSSTPPTTSALAMPPASSRRCPTSRRRFLQPWATAPSIGWESMANPCFGDAVADLFYAGPATDERAAVEALIADAGFLPQYVGGGPDAHRAVDSLATLWFALVVGQRRGRHLAFQLLTDPTS